MDVYFKVPGVGRVCFSGLDREGVVGLVKAKAAFYFGSHYSEVSDLEGLGILVIMASAMGWAVLEEKDGEFKASVTILNVEMDQERVLVHMEAKND